MNNDLEQFSEERLKYLADGNKQALQDEIEILARIALSAKQANPVAVLYKTGDVLTREECADNKVFAICCKVETPLYTTPQPAHAGVNSPIIPDGWIKYQDQKPSANDYISFVSRHGEYASGLVGEDEWVEMHDGTSFELAEIYIWLLLPPLPAAPKPESE